MWHKGGSVTPAGDSREEPCSPVTTPGPSPHAPQPPSLPPEASTC